jgi:hypothetical protein
VTVRGRHEGRARADATLLAALASGATAAEAAATAGVSERTVRRRLSAPDFAARLEQARAEILDVALVRLSARALAAVDVLAALTGPDVGPATRLGAAKAILDLGMRLRNELEMTARLDAIAGHLGLTEVT